MFYFRSFSFFKYANPTIKNGGLFGDSKMAIYKMFSPEYYPKTILITKNDVYRILEIVQSNHFEYPLIVKPDIGLRGIGVAKVINDNELKQYATCIQQDFLVQTLIPFPNEIGLFYYRLPNQKRGRISGITLKKFLTIQGNGQDTIEQLLKKNQRFELQIEKLQKYYDLNEVLGIGEERCLVPFGNHNRGTEFLDGKEFVTEQLETTFNSILKNVQGFYYGRLDIRFNTFEELEMGKNFSIIELNGVKSEPTHIYDPKHSLWHGQCEILAHQKIMKNIIKQVIQ
jgi:hypothetical protein